MIYFNAELKVYDLTKIQWLTDENTSDYLLGLFPIKDNEIFKETIYNLSKNYISDFFNEFPDIDPIFNLYVKRTFDTFVTKDYLCHLPQDNSVSYLHGQIRTCALSNDCYITMVGVIERNEYDDCLGTSIHIIVQEQNRS